MWPVRTDDDKLSARLAAGIFSIGELELWPCGCASLSQITSCLSWTRITASDKRTAAKISVAK